MILVLHILGRPPPTTKGRHLFRGLYPLVGNIIYMGVHLYILGIIRTLRPTGTDRTDLTFSLSGAFSLMFGYTFSGLYPLVLIPYNRQPGVVPLGPLDGEEIGHRTHIRSAVSSPLAGTDVDGTRGHSSKVQDPRLIILYYSAHPATSSSPCLSSTHPPPEPATPIVCLILYSIYIYIYIVTTRAEITRKVQ